MAHQTSARHNAFVEEKTNHDVWEANEGALFTPEDSGRIQSLYARLQ